MKLGIKIATYQRKDGTTPAYLTRALNSIKQQTHQDYKVFLVGDKYEDEDEFTTLCSTIIPQDQIEYINLPVAVERDRYPDGGLPLWLCGGANAMNHAIDMAIGSDVDFVCHLDHDDYWHPQHLEVINYTITNISDPNIAFIYTCSTYFNSKLPYVFEDSITESFPSPAGLCHSSACINHKLIPLKYRDVFEEEGITTMNSDADMWKRITELCQEKNYKSYLVPLLTCFHPEENH
jgi:glycosyltransferase involved in cell wall biosynthesis